MDVIDRIKKLLSLSKNNDNAEESSLCALRAQELMHRYRIGEADLGIEETERVAEEVTDSVVHTESGRALWKACLANGIAIGLGCKMYRWTVDGGTAFHVVGLQSSVQTVAYMFGYLKLEIEAQCERAWARHKRELANAGGGTRGLSGHARTWRNSFNMGAVNTVAARLKKAHEGQVAEAREKLAQQPTCTALALYKTDEERVATAYKAIKGLRSGRSARVNRVASAFEQGQSAGRSVQLNAKGGLPGSKSRLEA